MNKILDFVALLFDIRTNRNSEGNSYRPRLWLPVLLHYLKLAVIIFAGSIVLLLIISLLTKTYFKERNTHRQLEKLSTQLVQYQQKHKTLPITLENFIANDPLKRDMTIDSWGNGINYTPNHTGRSFTLTSPGPDRKLHTEDDLQVQSANRSAL
ncbi:hypothetical protein [Rufibacter roseus]|uniref:Type II secretion system protein GspG C-terminal domain-containing protein n=1 Tax=Rufibacter roseus TaxID=1567108 RepID=A0ABW2DEM7_9BACT|nr:hypothetical protein [Rufibacter roseus]